MLGRLPLADRHEAVSRLSHREVTPGPHVLGWDAQAERAVARPSARETEGPCRITTRHD